MYCITVIDIIVIIIIIVVFVPTAVGIVVVIVIITIGWVRKGLKLDRGGERTSLFIFLLSIVQHLSATTLAAIAIVITQIERFSSDCRKTNTAPKYLFTPTNHRRRKQRDEPIRVPIVALACNFLRKREKSRGEDAIGFGLASYWLTNWPEILRPVTKGGSNLNFRSLYAVIWKLLCHFFVQKNKIRVTNILLTTLENNCNFSQHVDCESANLSTCVSLFENVLHARHSLASRFLHILRAHVCVSVFPPFTRAPTVFAIHCFDSCYLSFLSSLLAARETSFNSTRLF